eukprot:IDg2298t1
MTVTEETAALSKSNRVLSWEYAGIKGINTGRQLLVEMVAPAKNHFEKGARVKLRT